MAQGLIALRGDLQGIVISVFEKCFSSNIGLGFGALMCAAGIFMREAFDVSLLFVFQYMTAAAAAAPMQGTYIPQYTPVPPTAVPVEVRPPHTLTQHSLTAKELFMLKHMCLPASKV